MYHSSSHVINVCYELVFGCPTCSMYAMSWYLVAWLVVHMWSPYLGDMKIFDLLFSDIASQQLFLLHRSHSTPTTHADLPPAVLSSPNQAPLPLLCPSSLPPPPKSASYIMVLSPNPRQLQQAMERKQTQRLSSSSQLFSSSKLRVQCMRQIRIPQSPCSLLLPRDVSTLASCCTPRLLPVDTIPARLHVYRKWRGFRGVWCSMVWGAETRLCPGGWQAHAQTINIKLGGACILGRSSPLPRMDAMVKRLSERKRTPNLHVLGNVVELTWTIHSVRLDTPPPTPTPVRMNEAQTYRTKSQLSEFPKPMAVHTLFSTILFFVLRFSITH